MSDEAIKVGDRVKWFYFPWSGPRSYEGIVTEIRGDNTALILNTDGNLQEKSLDRLTRIDAAQPGRVDGEAS